MILHAEIDLTKIEKIRSVYAEFGLSEPSYTAFVIKSVNYCLTKEKLSNKRLFKKRFRLFNFDSNRKPEDVDIVLQFENDVFEPNKITDENIIRMSDNLKLREIHQYLIRFKEKNLEDSIIFKKSSKCEKKLLIKLIEFIFKPFGLRCKNAVMINSIFQNSADIIIGNWGWPLTIEFGLVKKRFVIKDDRMKVCTTFNLILTFDRRKIDEEQAVNFCNDIVNCLNNFDEYSFELNI